MPLPVPKTAPGRLALALAAIGIVIVSGCGSTSSGSPPAAPSVGSSPPQGSTSPANDTVVFGHLEAFQKIADENGGNRASPSPGYDASVDYVVGALRGSGYDVSTPTYDGSGNNSDEDAPVAIRNVIAQTRTGDPNEVVVIGAHLDSVTEGPGIVDNGSGVAALLKIAADLGASPQVQNTVRFAFFGSEEEGAQGSTGYVENLSADERRTVMLYLNVDMIASPNGGYFVQGGKGSDESASGPAGSATVARVLADELGRTGVTAETIEFVGDDETPFIAAGIPSGGAENGDSKTKSQEQARAWGGQPGAVFDPCYHQACDNLDNVNREVISHYLPALAGTVAHFATSSERPSR